MSRKLDQFVPGLKVPDPNGIVGLCPCVAAPGNEAAAGAAASGLRSASSEAKVHPALI